MSTLLTFGLGVVGREALIEQTPVDAYLTCVTKCVEVAILSPPLFPHPLDKPVKPLSELDSAQIHEILLRVGQTSTPLSYFQLGSAYPKE
jgi:hypothetical protein